nr:hypothetical protein [Tanacetum cinerariifolium]
MTTRSASQATAVPRGRRKGGRTSRGGGRTRDRSGDQGNGRIDGQGGQVGGQGAEALGEGDLGVVTPKAWVYAVVMTSTRMPCHGV